MCELDMSDISAFHKQWLLTHALAITATFSGSLVSSSILWYIPCEADERKPLYKLSEAAITNTSSLICVISLAFKVWLRQTGYGVPTKESDLSSAAALSPVCLIAMGLAECYSVYELSGDPSSFMFATVQSCLAGCVSFPSRTIRRDKLTSDGRVTCLLAGAYDVVMMLKPKLHAKQPGADVLEKDAEKNALGMHGTL